MNAPKYKIGSNISIYYPNRAVTFNLDLLSGNIVDIKSFLHQKLVEYSDGTRQWKDHGTQSENTRIISHKINHQYLLELDSMERIWVNEEDIKRLNK